MQHYRYVIVGGGIAGTTAAETIRASDPIGKIAIISDEPHPLYSRVLLSKPSFLTGGQPLESAWLKKDQWYQEKNIHLFRGLSATHLDPAEHYLTLSDGDVLHYEKLLLATGAHVRRWDVPGADKEGVIYLRTLDDAKHLIDAIATKKHAVVVGSSCVSFEIIEILLSKGITVTEVMRENHFFEPTLSQPEAAMIEQELLDRNVTILRNTEIAKVLGKSNKVERVRLKDASNTEIACDMVLCFIGVVFDLEWLAPSGIATRRGILANEYLETNLPDVWTAGDVCECYDTVLGEVVIMGNWMSAREQGVVAAKNMTRDASQNRTVFEQASFHTSHGFGYTIGFTGDVRALPDRTIIVHPTQKEKSYCRLILKGNRIIGATVINRPDLMGIITKLIKDHVDISSQFSKLQDPAFDLGMLPVAV